jgi:hypothetical protein
MPTKDAFAESIVSIALGLYTFFLLFTVGGMAVIHTEYLVVEKTTNESVILRNSYILRHQFSYNLFNIRSKNKLITRIVRNHL